MTSKFGGIPIQQPTTGSKFGGIPVDAEPAERDSFGKNTMDVIAELAASANRSVTEFVDFLGPKTVNSILRLSGSDKQMPTLTGAMEGTGIQGGFMDAGVARDTVQTLGQGLTMGGGMVPVTRNLAKAGPAAAEFFGIGAAKTPVIAAGSASQQALDNLPAPTRALLDGSGDKVGARFRLDQYAPIESPRAVKDHVAIGAIDQGWDEGFVAMLKSSSKQGRRKFAQMVDIVEQGKKNFAFEANNRPNKVVGDSILTRVKVIKEANRAAGVRLGHVAKSLRGEYVDHSPAVNSFLAKIEDAGVVFDENTGKVSFDGSIFDDLSSPTNAIKRILSRMRKAGKNNDDGIADALDLHNFKQYIDEVVTYGSDSGGLKGKSERMLKSLRHDIDGILDDNFPEYNKVNNQYSETIGALDSLQDLGKKIDLTGKNADKALGILSRRLLSNAGSTVPLEDAIDELDVIARKYLSPDNQVVPYGVITKGSGVKASDLDDEIMRQVMVVDELEKKFGTAARTSLQGDTSKAFERAQQAADLSSKTATGVILEGGKAVYEKSRGINEDNALRAIKELLEGLK